VYSIFLVEKSSEEKPFLTFKSKGSAFYPFAEQLG
jgi:hypothetical protein